LDAYEEMIRHTSYKHAPWFVVPADNKWFSRMIVAAGIVDALEGMNLVFPRLDPAKLKELQEVRKAFGGASKSQRTKS